MQVWETTNKTNLIQLMSGIKNKIKTISLSFVVCASIVVEPEVSLLVHNNYKQANELVKSVLLLLYTAIIMFSFNLSNDKICEKWRVYQTPKGCVYVMNETLSNTNLIDAFKSCAIIAQTILEIMHFSKMKMRVNRQSLGMYQKCQHHKATN